MHTTPLGLVGDVLAGAIKRGLLARNAKEMLVCLGGTDQGELGSFPAAASLMPGELK